MCGAKYHMYVYVKVRGSAHIMVRGSPRALGCEEVRTL